MYSAPFVKKVIEVTKVAPNLSDFRHNVNTPYGVFDKLYSSAALSGGKVGNKGVFVCHHEFFGENNNQVPPANIDKETMLHKRIRTTNVKITGKGR